MSLEADDACIGLMVVSPNCTVLTVSELGQAKRSAFEDYRLTRRGAKGVANMKVTDKTGPVLACMTVQEQDDLMIITAGGMVVRIAVNGIRVLGRATQGVRAIRLDETDRVVAVAHVVGNDEKGEGPVDEAPPAGDAPEAETGD